MNLFVAAQSPGIPDRPLRFQPIIHRISLRASTDGKGSNRNEHHFDSTIDHKYNPTALATHPTVTEANVISTDTLSKKKKLLIELSHQDQDSSREVLNRSKEEKRDLSNDNKSDTSSLFNISSPQDEDTPRFGSSLQTATTSNTNLKDYGRFKSEVNLSKLQEAVEEEEKPRFIDRVQKFNPGLRITSSESSSLSSNKNNQQANSDEFEAPLLINSESMSNRSLQPPLLARTQQTYSSLANKNEAYHHLLHTKEPPQVQTHPSAQKRNLQIICQPVRFETAASHQEQKAGNRSSHLILICLISFSIVLITAEWFSLC